jgi:hypothetical protein
VVFLYGVVIGVLIGYLLGGRIARLVTVPLKNPWILFLALLIQFLIFPLFTERPLIPYGTAYLHGLSYFLVLVWLLRNLRIRPLWVLVGGALLNAAAILSNGGYMPASADALSRAGLVTTAERLLAEGTYGNVIRMGAGTHLNALGDRIALPDWIPFATALSIGDLMIMIGLAWLIARGMKGYA